jgi:hypothetical protein
MQIEAFSGIFFEMELIKVSLETCQVTFKSTKERTVITG